MGFTDRLKADLRTLAQAITRPRWIAAIIAFASRRGFVPAAIWRRLPVWGEVELELPGAKPIIYPATPEDAVARQLRWRGLDSPEGATIRIVAELAAEAHTFVDVGANVGLYTMVACAVNPGCEVIAFEPVEANRARFTENLRLNGFGEHCQLRSEALGDTTGSMRFYFPDRDAEHPFPTGGSLQQVGSRFVEVQVARGDDLLGELSPELIKLDVEGGEPEALRGLERLIDRSRPAIVLEITADKPTPGTEPLLLEAGYRFFEIGPRGPVASKSLLPDRTFMYLNYLCLADEDPRAHQFS